MAMLLKKNILDIADFMNNIIYLAFCWLLLTGTHFKLSFVLFLRFVQVNSCIYNRVTCLVNNRNKFSLGAPTLKRQKVRISYGKRRARRRQGA